jgi:hypothetical protein
MDATAKTSATLLELAEQIRASDVASAERRLKMLMDRAKVVEPAPPSALPNP